MTPIEHVRAFERHFLMRLAACYLACRWKVMGHGLVNWPFESDLPYDLLGMHDYGLEMKLVCAKQKRHEPLPWD